MTQNIVRAGDHLCSFLLEEHPSPAQILLALGGSLFPGTAFPLKTALRLRKLLLILFCLPVLPRPLTVLMARISGGSHLPKTRSPLLPGTQ